MRYINPRFTCLLTYMRRCWDVFWSWRSAVYKRSDLLTFSMVHLLHRLYGVDAPVCQRGHLQDGCHDVPLSSWSSTSVPRRPFHHVLRRRFSASSAFCKPSPVYCTSLSSQHIWPSGVLDRRSDGLELAAWRAQRSGLWFWQFQAVS